MTVREKIFCQKPLIFSMAAVFAGFLGAVGFFIGNWQMDILPWLLGGALVGFFVGCGTGLLMAVMNIFLHPKFRKSGK
jgi:hypothetical protein